MPAKRAHPEQALQIQVADWLRAIRLDRRCIWHHSPNGGRRTKAEAGLFKAMGVRAGWPDFVFIWRDSEGRLRVGFVELKAAKGSLSASQREFIGDCQGVGGLHAVCRTLENAADALLSWGLLKPSEHDAVARGWRAA